MKAVVIYFENPEATQKIHCKGKKKKMNKPIKKMFNYRY